MSESSPNLTRMPVAFDRYSDIILAVMIIAIITLMILPLPLFVIDFLVAINMLISVGLLLLAIYIPTATAFTSFPSVILLTTLFRLSLSIAITRLILLNGDAGAIIETFGNMAVGGNLVVGFVVFIIITVVQFIVIAKGSERVAEVAARFTLDAMPGKQLSIDSDLRSGLLTKDDAKAKRALLEVESQLHGSLDGAMKFVKGDAIAGIVILIINILGGLTIGVIQRGMTMGDAMHTYSILTIGDGLVAQIPALLTSISAGLIITRSSNENSKGHLGTSIFSQVTNYPRVIAIGGCLAFLFALIPGFPWPIFMILGLALVGQSLWKNKKKINGFLENRGRSNTEDSVEDGQANEGDLAPAPLEMAVSPAMASYINPNLLTQIGNQVIIKISKKYGLSLPSIRVKVDRDLSKNEYQLTAHGISIGRAIIKEGAIFIEKKSWLSAYDPNDTDDNTAIDIYPSNQGCWKSSGSLEAAKQSAVSLIQNNIETAVKRNLSVFLGIQETANIVNLWNEEYPDLIKEMLRVMAPQHLAEILRNLVKEGVSIRHMREIFELITDLGTQEKNLVVLSERIRVGLKRQISDQFSDSSRTLNAVVVHPELEDLFRQSIRDDGRGQMAIDPDLYQKFVSKIIQIVEEVDITEPLAVLCSFDLRRQVRQMLEEALFDLPVLSFQELVNDVKINPLIQVNL